MNAPPAGVLERTDEVNWSTLKAMATSPKHYLHGLTVPRPDTDAMRLGRLTHCMVYEPDLVPVRYVQQPHFHKSMNDATAIAQGYDGGKQAYAAWVDAAGDAEVVSTEQYVLASSMRLAIERDPVAAQLVFGGYSEHAITWTDPITGIACRGRVDHVNGCLCDLKTTRSLATCERDAARLMYHAQLAWYADGLAAAGIVTKAPPCLLFVENVPPHDVLVLTFDEDDIAAGRRVYRACLDRLAECRRTGEWPGVSGGVSRRIQLPQWALYEEDDDDVAFAYVNGVAVEVR